MNIRALRTLVPHIKTIIIVKKNYHHRRMVLVSWIIICLFNTFIHVCEVGPPTLSDRFVKYVNILQINCK